MAAPHKVRVGLREKESRSLHRAARGKSGTLVKRIRGRRSGTGAGVLDVLVGLLHGLLGLGLGVRVRLESGDGLAEAQLLGAGGRRAGGRGGSRFAGHITLEGVEIEPRQVVGDVDGGDALAEVLEAVASLLRRDAFGEQLPKIV